MTLWIAAWTTVVLFATWAIGGDIWAQWGTRWFAETRGTITHSKIDVAQDAEGTTYALEIRYTYAVGPQTLEGNVYKFDHSGSGARRYYAGVLAKHPAGAAVPVFYDPAEPGRAVLVQGHEDLFGLLFLFPFVGTLLMAWFLAWRRIRFECFEPLAGGLPVSSSGPHIQQVRIADETRLVLVGACVFSGSIVLVLVASLVGAGPRGSAAAQAAFLALNLLAGPLLYFWLRTSDARLTLDALRRELILLKRGQLAASFAFDEVIALWVEQRTQRTSDGPFHSYAVRLSYERDAEPRSIELGVHSDEDRAVAFRDWLATQISHAPLSSSRPPRTARPERSAEERAVALESHLDANGLGWDAEHRGGHFVATPARDSTRGYAAFSEIALLLHGCGSAHDEIDLQLRGGARFTLPRNVTGGDVNDELLLLLTEEFPEVTVVEGEGARARR
jgi:hypothetical protein